MEAQSIIPVQLNDVSLITCAWCLAELGITPQTGSHGICERHRAMVMAQSARRIARKASSND